LAQPIQAVHSLKIYGNTEKLAMNIMEKAKKML